MRAIAIIGVVLTLAGCFPAVVTRDRDASCRMARSMLRESLTAADMVELSAPFPRAHYYAKRAYASRIAGIVLTSLGGAALVGAFVTGFAADTNRSDVKSALYGTVGGTIGLGAGALLAGTLYLRAKTRATVELERETSAECP